ncbi:MAG: hypothetical protein OXF98_11600 [Rhodospirillaceae bacterium]|nr:hypothetical protein [Rhodospirillaceae bacterium]
MIAHVVEAFLNRLASVCEATIIRSMSDNLTRPKICIPMYSLESPLARITPL